MTNKFSHLDTEDISKEAIQRFGSKVEFVANPKLPEVKEFFETHAKHSDPEIRTAANQVIAKIDYIISKTNSKKQVSGTIMKIANMNRVNNIDHIGEQAA